MGKVQISPHSAELPLRPVYDISALPRGEQEALRGLLGPDATIEAVMYSDLLSSGNFGLSRLVVTDEEVVVAEGELIKQRVALSELVSVHCREYVGNGLLTGQKREEDERRELVRYSKTLAEPFEEMADWLNRRLGASTEQVQQQDEELAKVSGPKEERTYRCPNCGAPLSSPGDVCMNCASKSRILRRLVSFLKNYKGLVAAGALLSVLATLCAMGPAFMVRFLIDHCLNPDEPVPPMDVRLWRMYVLVGGFAALLIGRMVIQHYRLKVTGTLGEKLVFDLRMRLYRALQRLSLSYFDREHTGRIMSRVLRDSRDVQRFVVQGLQNGLVYGLMVLAIPVVLFAMNAKLAVIALIPVPLVVLLARWFSRRFRTIYRTIRRRYATMSAAVSDSVSGVRVVKSFAQEEREMSGFGAIGRQHFDAQLTAVRSRALFHPTVIAMMGVGTLLVWLFGGRLVLKEAISLGVLVMFISYMNQLYNPVQQLIRLTEVFQSSATAAERIFAIMDTPREVSDHERTRSLENVEGRIALENVSFNYEDGERVLKNINLVIRPGEMVGLVGQTGSGKSTLVSLVCRFYDPTSGRITLDRIDLRDIQIKSLRQNIGMVLQETFLFVGSIRDNIAYGKPDATQEEIMAAARAANAHDFIMGLPDGYDTEVGERGVGLSGGEKQRVAIARAILKDPAILILDEATSAVDTATEVSIQEAMDRLIKGRTTIAIAHRLSTLRNADRLLVIEGGQIIEEGTHEELIRRGGVYAELCRIQANFAKEVEQPK